MDKHQAAQQVADSLFEAEHALDEALAKAAHAIAVATASRTALGVSLKTGASAVTKMAEGAAALASVRETFAAAHDQIAVVQRAIGVRPNMTGGGEKDPQHSILPASVRRVA